MRRVFFAIAFSVLSLLPAQARWRPEYVQLPQEVRDWYAAAELTQPAQKRFPYKKCCDHADVFRTKFRVDKNSGEDQWFYFSDGNWKQIPSDIIHWGEHAPDGRPTLFLYHGHETCFYPGESGI